jgi:hypothetical protein
MKRPLFNTGGRKVNVTRRSFLATGSATMAAIKMGKHVYIQKPLTHTIYEAREVRQRIATVGRNGGLIVAPSHNIHPDVPIENILALYETVAASAV